MERTSRNRNPVVALLAVVVAVLTTWILAAPYAGPSSGGDPGHGSGGASTPAPCIETDAPAAATEASAPVPAAEPAWATEEKLGGP